MSSLLATFPEASVAMGNLYIRHDLINHCVTICLKESFSWHVDTEQMKIANGVYHFIEPDGKLVGIKSFAVADGNSSGTEGRNLL